jgi:hypothetical protein
MPAEVKSLDYVFGVDTELWFYDDSQIEPISARAIRASGKDAAIYIGNQLISAEIKGNPDGWPTAIIGILAHEWGHAYQYLDDLDEKFFIWETHADYLAGWYLGVRYARGAQNIDVDAFASSLFKRGSRYFSENAYGLPEQRVNAMRSGFAWAIQTRGRMKPDDAARRGYNELLQILKSKGVINE